MPKMFIGKEGVNNQCNRLPFNSIFPMEFNKGEQRSQIHASVNSARPEVIQANGKVLMSWKYVRTYVERCCPGKNNDLCGDGDQEWD